MKRGKTQVQFGLRKINGRCKERFKECHVSNKQLVTGVSSEVASVVHFVQNVFLHTVNKFFMQQECKQRTHFVHWQKHLPA